MQELLGTWDLGAHGLTNDVHLQWAAQIEFPCVERLFGLSRCATPQTAIGRAGAPAGAAHPSDSFGVIHILVCQVEIVSEVPGGSSDLRLTDDCHTLHRCSALRRGAKNAAEFSVMSTRAVS